MVNPDVVGTIQSDSIAAPDVLGVEFGDMDVLNDDVVCAASETQSLATKHTRTTDTDNGFVGGDLQALEAGVIVGALGGWIVTTPVGSMGLDGILAGAAAAVGVRDAALVISAGILAANKVTFLVDQDYSRGVVREPGLQLGQIAWRGGRGVTTTGGTTSKAESSADDPLGLGRSTQEGSCCQQRTKKGHSKTIPRKGKVTERARECEKAGGNELNQQSMKGTWETNTNECG